MLELATKYPSKYRVLEAPDLVNSHHGLLSIDINKYEIEVIMKPLTIKMIHVSVFTITGMLSEARRDHWVRVPVVKRCPAESFKAHVRSAQLILHEILTKFYHYSTGHPPRRA